MSEICIYVKMPSYLRQWLIHRHGGCEPIQLVRGSTQEQMQVFRSQVIVQYSTSKPIEEQVIRSLQAYELQLLTDIQVHPQCYYDLVTIIRERPDNFPAWHTSPVADLYTPKIFQNKKNSSAYWF